MQPRTHAPCSVTGQRIAIGERVKNSRQWDGKASQQSGQPLLLIALVSCPMTAAHKKLNPVAYLKVVTFLQTVSVSSLRQSSQATDITSQLLVD